MKFELWKQAAFYAQLGVLIRPAYFVGTTQILSHPGHDQYQDLHDLNPSLSHSSSTHFYCRKLFTAAPTQGLRGTFYDISFKWLKYSFIFKTIYCVCGNKKFLNLCLYLTLDHLDKPPATLQPVLVPCPHKDIWKMDALY